MVKNREIDPILGEIPSDLVESLSIDSTKLPTVKELGNVLPIGFNDTGNTVHKEFSFKEYTWEMEEELGEIVEKNPEMGMSEYISELLCHFLINVGTIDLNKYEVYKRKALLRSMYFTDVLYMYVCLRIHSIGSELKLNPFKCSCNNVINYVGDLNSLEVKIPEVRNKEIILKKGMIYANKNVKSLTIGPLKWSFMEVKDDKVLVNRAKLRLETIRHSIVSIKGAPSGNIYITSNHLRSMNPIEVHKLFNVIDNYNAGIIMQIDGKCNKCDKEFSYPIDWSYDNFFDLSSL